VGLHAGLGLAYNVSCTGLEFVAYHLEHCAMYCSAIESIEYHRDSFVLSNPLLLKSPNKTLAVQP
jgi:hypothetical protein